MLHGKQIKDSSITKEKLSLTTPSSASDPTTKQYVDDAIAQSMYNQDWKNSVRVASTANVNIASAPASIDGVTLSNGNRVLLKNQTAGSENGIYVFNGSGSAMTRAEDANTSAEVTSGMAVSVEEGTQNQRTSWKLTTANPIVLATTSLAFELFVVTSSPVLTNSNKRMTAEVTDSDGDVGCNTAIASTPSNDSHVLVDVNGVLIEVGDGVKTKESYFSGDSGVTARNWTDILAGDKLYWNGSIAGYELAATDKVTFNYQV